MGGNCNGKFRTVASVPLRKDVFRTKKYNFTEKLINNCIFDLVQIKVNSRPHYRPPYLQRIPKIN